MRVSFDCIEPMLQIVQVLLDRLNKQIEAGDSGGDAAVLYYLQRRRLPEALQTFKSLKPVRGRNLSFCALIRAPVCARGNLRQALSLFFSFADHNLVEAGLFSQ